MRILFVAHSFPRWDGDVPGNFLLQLATALTARGVAVRVVAPAADGAAASESIHGVDVRRVRYAPASWQTIAYTGEMADAVKRSWTARAALAGLIATTAGATARHARDFGADVIHAHWWFPGALAATLPGVAGGRPVVVTAHGSDVRLARGIASARRLCRAVARRCTAVAAVSSWLCSQLRAMAPDAPDCEVAPMPVAPGLFHPPSLEAKRAGVLFVGRLNEQKGIASLLRAFAQTPSDTRLTVVGTGPDADASRRLASSLGVGERVEWRTVTSQSELADLYRSAEVLAVPSRDEGLGLVAAEAALCGTPVVAYASGGITDVVVDGVTGRLVTLGDETALASALRQLIADPGHAASLGAAGAIRARDRFTADAAAARYLAIYERARLARTRETRSS